MPKPKLPIRMVQVPESFIDLHLDLAGQSVKVYLVMLRFATLGIQGLFADLSMTQIEKTAHCSRFALNKAIQQLKDARLIEVHSAVYTQGRHTGTRYKLTGIAQEL